MRGTNYGSRAKSRGRLTTFQSSFLEDLVTISLRENGDGMMRLDKVDDLCGDN